MTALAASIGTGNVAGVATAIISGGPGALFWIWCYGLVAMAIKLTEAVLGRQFRVSGADGLSTGPMYYLRDGLKSPTLAWIYALVAGVAALTTTPFTQPNSIADVLRAQVGIPTIVSGIVLAVLTWLVIIGGLTPIGRVVERLSPLKVGLYLAGGLVVIVTYGARLPEVLALVVTEAFSTRAVAGRLGRRRACWSRCATAWRAASTPTRPATARRPSPTARRRAASRCSRGCTPCSRCSSSRSSRRPSARWCCCLTGAWQSGERGAGAVVLAFDAAMPGFGGWVVAFCVFLFGYTTLIGWAYYGEQFLEYLLGRRVSVPYRWIYCLLIPFGAVSRVDVVWAWGDLMNALQVFPNMVGLIGLSGLVAAALAARRASSGPRATRG